MQSRLVRTSVNISLLILVNLLWSTSSTAFKLVEQMGPIAVGFLMYLIAMPIILPFYAMEQWNGKAANPSVPKAERSFWRWKNFGNFLVIGVLAAFGAIFTASGIAHTTASNGALLGLTVPVITALLAAVILGERMTVARWLSLACALVGVLLLSVRTSDSATQGVMAIDVHDLGHLNRDFVIGNLLILAGCTTAALYNVCSKGLLSRFSTLEVLTYGFALVLATDLILLFFLEPQSLPTLLSHSARVWVGLLLLGVVSTAMGTMLWLFLLTRLDVGQAVVSVYLGPVFGVMLAAIFLHEQITIPMIVGGLITLVGTVLVVSLDGASHKPKKTSDVNP